MPPALLAREFGMRGEIRIGISGWRYAGWRGRFYPKGLAQRRELEYASRKFGTIELNGTHYALQRPEVARLMAETCDISAEGSYLRMEYIQDTDGAWLEPHRDIPEKLFSMVIYLCTGPDAKDWGTDIYDDQRRWVGRSSAQFDSAVIFVAGPNTWHGFEKRPIEGVRRSVILNYVTHDWRAREQLSYPNAPVRL